jgi:hypothetical protein
LYIWTGSCIANPEYEPEDMLKVVLHALASSEAQDTPFLAVMILPVWEDTPWNSAAIRGHHNMSTLIRIPAGHMRFVPAHKQTDEVTPILSPAKWPVEFVLIANSRGRESFLDHERIHRILCPAIPIFPIYSIAYYINACISYLLFASTKFYQHVLFQMACCVPVQLTLRIVLRYKTYTKVIIAYMFTFTINL